MSNSACGKKVIRLLEEYDANNMLRSYLNADDPSYIAINEIGKDALPSLFDSIDSKHARTCFPLIRSILGRKPEVPEESRGRTDHIKLIFMSWREELRKEGEAV